MEQRWKFMRADSDNYLIPVSLVKSFREEEDKGHEDCWSNFNYLFDQYRIDCFTNFTFTDPR